MPQLETVVHLGDSFDVMSGMPSRSVDLVYVDPPFFSQKVHALHTRDRAKSFPSRTDGPPSGSMLSSYSND